MQKMVLFTTSASGVGLCLVFDVPEDDIIFFQEAVDLYNSDEAFHERGSDDTAYLYSFEELSASLDTVTEEMGLPDIGAAPPTCDAELFTFISDAYGDVICGESTADDIMHFLDGCKWPDVLCDTCTRIHGGCDDE